MRAIRSHPTRISQSGCRTGLKILVTRTSLIGQGEALVQIRGERGGIDAPFTPLCSIQQVKQHHLNEDGEVETRMIEGTEGDWTWNLIGPIVLFAEAVRKCAHQQPSSRAADQVIIHRVLDAIYESARGNSFFIKISPRNN